MRSRFLYRLSLAILAAVVSVITAKAIPQRFADLTLVIPMAAAAPEKAAATPEKNSPFQVIEGRINRIQKDTIFLRSTEGALIEIPRKSIPPYYKVEQGQRVIAFLSYEDLKKSRPVREDEISPSRRRTRLAEAPELAPAALPKKEPKPLHKSASRR